MIKNESGQAVIEAVIASGTLLALITAFLFFLTFGALSMLLETESYEALVCQSEGRKSDICQNQFLQKIKLIPIIEIKNFRLYSQNDKSEMDLEFEIKKIGHFHRHESIYVE
jgi:hypothetical protein